jgi:hypothetical protein
MTSVKVETTDRQESNTVMNADINNELVATLASFVTAHTKQRIDMLESGLSTVLTGLRLTDLNVDEIKLKLAKSGASVTAEQVAENININEICERIARIIDTNDIADHITARDVAREIDMSEIANEISTSDLAEELSQYLDSGEIAGQVEIDHQELAEYVNDEELANQLASNDDFVESVAKAVANRPGEHTTVTADAVQVTAENLINDKLAAACDRIVEQVTQRVLAHIGNTLVSLLTAGSKQPQ